MASKHPFFPIKMESRLMGIELSDYNLRLLGVYVPTGSKDKKFKDLIWQEILQFAQENKDTTCIITGDFNSCTKEDSMNKTQYNAAELEKLRNIGWIDSWAHYNDESEGYTWYSNVGNGFRFDYAFLSPKLAKELEVVDVNHDSKKREEKMSDHSPLIMEYSLLK